MRARVLSTVAAVEEPAHDLDLLSKVLETLERQQFHSAPLKTLSTAIDARSGGASHQIARLRRLTDMLDSRDNPLVRALGPLVLWTTQVAMAVEAWHADNGPQVAAWLNAVSEIEALSSLANYAWEHPDDPFPAFVEDGCPPRFEGEEMRHPLLAEDHSIPNSVRLADPLQLLIVSGSNMSGKSTLLRTVGVNAVLALAGAPVRAKRLTLSRLSPRRIDSDHRFARRRPLPLHGGNSAPEAGARTAPARAVPSRTNCWAERIPTTARWVPRA